MGVFAAAWQDVNWKMWSTLTMQFTDRFAVRWIRKRVSFGTHKYLGMHRALTNALNIHCPFGSDKPIEVSDARACIILTSRVV